MTKENKETPKLTNKGFVVDKQYRDFFSDIQHGQKRIGEVGDVSQEFLDHAFHQLAKDGEGYTAPDGYGTDGRENNKNVNRMEYDKVERHDDKDHKTVLKSVNQKKTLTVKELLGILRPNKDGFTVDTTHTKTGDKPIK